MSGLLKNNYFLKGFQPPLRNVKPRSQFDMNIRIVDRFDSLKLKKKSYKNCIEIEGKGKTSFIGDTRSGPINVDVLNNEWVM